MSDKKFTSGEWSQSHREGGDGMYNTEVYDYKGETICTLAWHPVYDGNGIASTDREANAHLIAAAPEMYEMLDMIMNILNGDDFENEVSASDIQNLLKEARGEQ